MDKIHFGFRCYCSMFYFLLQTSYKKEFSTNSLIYGSVLQTEETIQTMQQSVSQSVVNHVKKLLPPQNNISLETADFIVSDNRGDTQLLGYQSAEVFWRILASPRTNHFISILMRRAVRCNWYFTIMNIMVWAAAFAIIQIK